MCSTGRGGRPTLHGIRMRGRTRRPGHMRGTTRVGEGNRRPSHACRVRVWRLRAVSMGGSEKKTTISGRKRLIDFFNSRSVHDTVHSSAFRRETPSARTLVMPRRNPTLPVRTHGQTQRHARPSEKSTGFEVLDSIVSRRLRKSVGIRA